jgi:hypothetical protein
MERVTKWTIGGVVLLHLAVAISHGSAHRAAGVALSPAAMAFVVVVIMIGPLAGLVWMYRNPRLGLRVIAVTMTGALLFGLVNHFVIPGADRVDHVVASARGWFKATAVLLVLTEGAGALLGIAYGWRAARRIT